jgi:hypothetical protein
MSAANLVTAADITAVEDSAKAALGTSASIDIMLDCAPNCFALCMTTQIQFLVLCSAAALLLLSLSSLPRLLK